MAIYYRKSQSDRIKRLEEKVIPPVNPLLIVDQNKDGTYGKDNLTESELEQYVKENKYGVVFIDDIINGSE